MGLVRMIASDNYIVVNKQIAQAFGLEEAVILGELASEMQYWKRRGELKDGFFYSTIENVKDSTTISDKRQRSALKTLNAAGIVEVKLSGLPARRYIRINEDKLSEILLDNESENGITSFAEMEELEAYETAELEASKRQGNNNNIKSNKNSNNKDIYIAVVDYLNEKAGTHYRASSKTTQQHINARIAEGFTVDDFKRVIENKCADWIGGEFEQYLRPSTLFGSKFENYLNAKQQTKGRNGIAVNSSKSDLHGVF